MSTIWKPFRRLCELSVVTSFQQMRKANMVVCSNGDANWCKLKKSACSGVANEHKYSLPPADMNAVKPFLRGPARVYL